MAYKDVKAKFRTDFKTRISSVADANIFLDNTQATQKDNGIWIVLHINEGESFNLSIGTTITRRYPGLMTAQVFDPFGNASTNIETVVQEIITDYANLNLAVGDAAGSVIRFRSPYVTRVGQQSGMYQLNVNCPYYFDL